MAWPHNILLLLFISACISAEDNALPTEIALPHPDITIPTAKTIPTTVTEIPKPKPTHNLCNESQNEYLGNVSKEGRDCLRKFIFSQANQTMNNTYVTTCNTIESVNQSIFTLLNASEQCYEKKKMPIIFAAGKKFVELLHFSVAEDKHFKELFETGFVKCVSETKIRNRQCVLNGTGLEKYGPRLKMSNLMNLELAETGCSQSRIIRLCVEETLKNETACKTNHIEYVDFLFNYTSQHCMQKIPNDHIISSKMSPGTIAATVLVLAAVVTITAVAIQKRRQERSSQRVHYILH